MATTKYEDVTLRLPVGLKERVLAEEAMLADIFNLENMTLSEVTAVALENWINE